MTIPSVIEVNERQKLNGSPTESNLHSMESTRGAANNGSNKV